MGRFLSFPIDLNFSNPPQSPKYRFTIDKSYGNGTRYWNSIKKLFFNLRKGTQYFGPVVKNAIMPLPFI